MNSALLTTKLEIPPPPRHVLRRTRLITTLERNLSRYKLTLVLAAAGYGKTTCLAQWAYTSQFAVVWLSLGEEDNDLHRFFQYLLTGWERVQPGIGDSPLGLLISSVAPDIDALLTAFVNAADHAHGHTIFVLDDYHVIDEPSLHQALSFLVDHLPSTLHFVLATRCEPPLPLARYRTRQELLELRAQDLRFLLQETTEFLNSSMGLTLAPDRIVKLQAQMEGWIAGLQLVALGHRQGLTGANRQPVSSRQRFIADYWSEEVLAQLPDDTRDFLLQTSILDALCGSLCDAVTERTDGRKMLHMLERASLFLVPLDDSRTWFRYHRLFADFLQAELHQSLPDKGAILHRRAAAWYLEQELPEQAYDHAVAGEDAERVIHLLERYAFI